MAGPIITLGRNTNATNTGAGSIDFLDKAGTHGYVWQDAAGNLRINTSAPSNANDTAGTVIGAQTSLREYKQDIEDFTDYSSALDKIINAPLHTYRYINEVNGYGEDSPLAKTHIGFIADEVDSIFMQGNVIDQVTVNGLLMASIKEMDLKIMDISNMEVENTWRDSLLAWFSSATNGITEFFTKKIHTEEICVKKTDGTEFCVTGDQLEQAMGNLGGGESTNLVEEETFTEEIPAENNDIQGEEPPVEEPPTEETPAEAPPAEEAPAESSDIVAEEPPAEVPPSE